MGNSFLTKVGVALLGSGGIILWNTWVLGFLDHGIAGYTQMSISELNVSGQPFSQFFTLTEWLSGFFMLVGGLLLMYTVRKAGYLMLTALALTTIIGGLTMFDATHPVDCNRYQNPACELKWARGEVSTTQRAHGVESETTNYVTILLSIELVLWAIHDRLSTPKLSLIEFGFVAVLALTVIIPLFISSNNIVTEAIGQRVWNTLTSVLVLYIIYRIERIRTATAVPPQTYSHRKTRKAIA